MMFIDIFFFLVSLLLFCACNTPQTTKHTQLLIEMPRQEFFAAEDCLVVDSLNSHQYYKSDTISVISIRNSEIIPDNCFSFCPNLRAVTLSERTSVLGSYCFFACKALDTINLERVRIFGNSCLKFSFLYTADLQSAVEIDDFAFSGCSRLSEVQFGDSIKRIGDFAFYLDSALTSCTIPNAEVGIGAFMNCTNLQSVQFVSREDGIAKLGSSSFCGCTSLRNVVLSNDLSEIPENAFYGCLSLQQITIPETVRVIGKSAFQKSGLERIVIPHSVIFIAEEAFAECYSLQEVILSNKDSVHYSSSSFPSNTKITYIKL